MAQKSFSQHVHHLGFFKKIILAKMKQIFLKLTHKKPVLTAIILNFIPQKGL